MLVVGVNVDMSSINMYVGRERRRPKVTSFPTNIHIYTTHVNIKFITLNLSCLCVLVCVARAKTPTGQTRPTFFTYMSTLT